MAKMALTLYSMGTNGFLREGDDMKKTAGREFIGDSTKAVAGTTEGIEFNK
jgi:hypothetical protein